MQWASLVHPQIVFQNISGGKVDAQAAGADQFRELAAGSKAFFSYRRQQVTKYEFSGPTAVADIAYEGVLAVDLPNGMPAGERIKRNGQSQFEFKDGRIYRLTDIS